MDQLFALVIAVPLLAAAAMLAARPLLERQKAGPRPGCGRRGGVGRRHAPFPVVRTVLDSVYWFGGFRPVAGVVIGIDFRPAR